MLGAIVITILPELLRQLPGNLIHYRLVIYSALLVVIMLTRPQGVMGSRRVWDSLAEARTARRKATNPLGKKACRLRNKHPLPQWTVLTNKTQVNEHGGSEDSKR